MKFSHKILLLFTILFLSFNAYGQRSNFLFSRCPGASPSPAEARVEILKTGDINLVPCATKTLKLNGSTIAVTGLSALNGLVGSTQTFAVGAADTAAFSSATTTHTLNLPITAVTGTSRTNYFPNFTGQNSFGKSPFAWNGTNYTFNNTALNSEFTLDFMPSTSAGHFRVGDFTTTPTSYFDLDSVGNTFLVATSNTVIQSPQISFVTDTVSNDFTNDSINLGREFTQFNMNFNGIIAFGDINDAQNKTAFTLNDNTRSFTFSARNNDGTLDTTGITSFRFNRTVTAAGTTGNQTINTPIGTVNFAAGSSDITVTSAAAGANSLISCTVQSQDATATGCRITNKLNGSFHVRTNANPTTETSVMFWITN